MRIRREPPPLRQVRVVRRELLTPHLVSVTLGGPELEGLDPGLPAASVRLLVPRADALEVPTWNGNEFLLADGSRPPLRTLTPRRWHGERHELDVEIVLHGDGPLSSWAATVEPNARLTFASAMLHRTCSLSGYAGGTRVEIVERIGGPFYPFVARMIPPLDENFEQVAADLKKAAEATAI